MAKDLPAKLYRYQSFEKYSLENLINMSIYFSKPESFNDPFDSWDTIRFLEPNGDEWEKIITAAISASIKSNKLITETEEEARVKTKLVFKKYQEQRKMKMREHGVACFSATAVEILLWSHYADKHKGFCLEFDTRIDPFNKAQEMHYLPEYAVVSFADLTKNDDDPKFLEAAEKLVSDKCTKSPGWGYELEWRIFNIKANISYHYDPSALTGVYFGCLMSSEDKRIIHKILEGTKTAFYCMERSTTGFEVKPQPYMYVP